MSTRSRPPGADLDLDLGIQASTLTSLLPPERVGELVTLARSAGATVISTSTSWPFVQPTPDGPLNFQGIDRVVSAARAAGLGVRLQLTGTPPWAVRDGPAWSQNRPPLGPEELARWTTFVTSLAEHVAGRVDFLEVWNEPNSTTYWPTGPDPAAYAALLAATYDAVEAVAPDLEVVTGGLAGNDAGYLQWLYAALDARGDGPGSRPFDLVGVHPFTGTAAPDQVEESRLTVREPFGAYDANFVGYRRLHDVMLAAGDTDTDLYIGAFGYGSQEVDGIAGVPDEVRATYAVQALEDLTCSTYVRAFSWYYLHPTPFDDVAWTLVDEALQPNRTYDALVAWSAAARESETGS